jgi:hypothetical protein
MTYRSRRLQRIEAMVAEMQRRQDLEGLQALLPFVHEKLRRCLAGESLDQPGDPSDPPEGPPIPEAEGARERLKERLEQVRERLLGHVDMC